MKTTKKTTKNDLEALYSADPVKACRLALRRTACVPENDRLDAINRLLGAYGVEAVRGEWQNGYWCDIVADYVNIGDTYAVTVIRQRGETSMDASRFIVAAFGDWVESYERKHGSLA